MIENGRIIVTGPSKMRYEWTKKGDTQLIHPDDVEFIFVNYFGRLCLR